MRYITKVINNPNIMGMIFAYIPYLEMLNCRIICKSWNDLISNKMLPHPYVLKCIKDIEYNSFVKKWYAYKDYINYIPPENERMFANVNIVINAHYINDIYLRLNGFQMDCNCYCDECGDDCIWNGVDYRCENDCRKDFYWTYEHTDMLRDTTIYADNYLGDGRRG